MHNEHITSSQGCGKYSSGRVHSIAEIGITVYYWGNSLWYHISIEVGSMAQWLTPWILFLKNLENIIGSRDEIYLPNEIKCHLLLATFINNLCYGMCYDRITCGIFNWGIQNLLDFYMKVDLVEGNFNILWNGRMTSL